MEDILTHSGDAESNCGSIEITVEEPQKIGDGMNSYLAYKYNYNFY
jgi:hypothetical protein